MGVAPNNAQQPESIAFIVLAHIRIPRAVEMN